MQPDRWTGSRSLATGRDADAVVMGATDAVQVDGVVGFLGGIGTGTAVALAVGGLLVLGGGAAAVRFLSESEPQSDDGARAEPTGAAANGTEFGTDSEGTAPSQPGSADLTDPQIAFEDRIGEETLERLEPIAPDAVAQVRDRTPVDDGDGAAAIDRLERDLRRGVEEAIADGRLDPTVTSTFGEPYEIVNLPSRYREVTLPPSAGGTTIHVSDIETTAADALEEAATVREAAATIATLSEHCREIETHVDRKESAFVDRYDEIEDTLADVRSLTDRFEGALGQRVEEFVLEGRHGELTGVVEIERELEAARRELHRCSFDDATRTLDRAEQAAETVLVTVDFLGGLLGTVDHGNGTVDVPAEVPTAVVDDIAPLIEQEFDAGVEVADGQIVIDGASAGGDGAAGRDRSRRRSATVGTGTGTREGADDENGRRDRDRAGVATAVESERDSDAGSTRSRERVTPAAVADEILFVLRELEAGGAGDPDTVEYQTEHLPDAVAQPAVLEELATFCRRQTDVVRDVTVQEGAPPGFLEIEFEGATAQDGLETLRKRFVDRHGRGE